MPQIVEIPDVGEVEFPDTMSQSEISDVIQNKILKKAPAAPAVPPISIQPNPLQAEQLRSGMVNPSSDRNVLQIPSESEREASNLVLQKPFQTVGKALHKGGRILTAIPEDIAYNLAVPSDDPLRKELGATPSLKAAISGTPDPASEVIDTLPQPARFVTKASKSVVETAPQLAAVALAEFAGIPAPVAAGLIFGTTEEGFDAKAAAIGAALPIIGKYGGSIAENVATKFNVSNETALNAVKVFGNQAAANTFMAADQALAISKLPKEERAKAWEDAIAANVGISLLGLGELKGGKTPPNEPPPSGPRFSRTALPKSEEVAKAAPVEKESEAPTIGTTKPAPPVVGEAPAPVQAAIETPKLERRDTGNPTELLDYAPEHLERYKQLSELVKPKSVAELQSPEFQKNVSEFETLRNHYNGNPPKQLAKVKIEPAKPIEAEIPPVVEQPKPAEAEPVAPKESPFQPGAKVLVRTKRGAYKNGVIAQHLGDDDFRVRITKDGSYDVFKLSQIQDRPSAAGKKRFEAEFEGMTQPERAQAKRDRAEFMRVIRSAGPEHGWLPADATLPTDLKSQGAEVGVMEKSAIARAWEEAKLEGNSESALDQSKNLAKLKAYVEANPGRKVQEFEFDRLAKEPREGAFEQDMGEMTEGSTIEVDGETLNVTKRDPDTGEITLSDGRRFGEQKVNEGESLWVEKVTHPDGAPEFLPEENKENPIEGIIVYRATPRSSQGFSGDNISYGSSGIGFHFGTRNAAEKILSDHKSEGTPATIKSFQITIRKPIRITDKGTWFADDIAKEIQGKGILTKEEVSRIGDDRQQLVIALKSKGYDGFIYENAVEDAGKDSYIVFEPRQIRSSSPKLRPGEKGTGDLLSTQTEDLTLASESTKDGERITAEKTKAEKDAAEAKAVADKQQLDMLDPERKGMGGAIDKEFERGAGNPTAMKYRLIDEERQQRGLPPLTKGESVSDQAVMDRAMAEIDRNPSLPEQLTEELTKNPRVIEDWENHVLLLHKIDLRDAYEKSARAAVQAFEDSAEFPERKADMIRHNAETQRISDLLTDVEKASRLSGSARGRALRSLRVMANEDFSLAALETSARASKNGAPLTDGERAALVKTADDYKKANEALEKHSAEKDERIARMEVAAEIERQKAAAAARRNTIPQVILKKAEEIVAKLDKSADDARAELRKLGTRTFTGLDPTIATNLAKIGASHIAHVGLDFAKWSAKMVDEFGAKIQPHLAALYKRSQAIIDELGTDAKTKKAVKTGTASPVASAKKVIEERISDGERGAITGQVQKIARSFIADGISEREALIDAVHAVLQEVDPSFTRRETMDAISGYGDFKQLTKDEISVTLRGLKGEMQQVAKLDDMANKLPPSKTGVERRTPTDEERRLIKLVNEAKIKFQVPITDARTQLKSALDTRKSQLKSRIEEYQRRIAEGDFSKKPRRTLNLDAEAQKLEHDLFKVKKKFNELLMQNRLANRNIVQKVIGTGAEVVNASRSVMTGLDLSAVLRQGGFITLAHPIRAAKAFPAMFRAFRSEAGAHASDVEITKRKNYALYNASKLYLSEHGQKLSQMEEAYMSRWADKIPLIAGSQRAYTTFLNRLRADSFDAMASSLTPDGKVTEAEAKIISNFINVATGRGNFGMKENALVGLNTVFFAPRYAASRFQLLAMQPLYHGLITGDKSMRANTGHARAQVAKEYARFLVGAAVVYALAQMAGGDVEDDPRSSDFGKVRLGNTRVDPMAGLVQATTFLSRMTTGESKTIGGKVKPARSSDTLISFLRNKLSPVFGAALDARDLAVGQKTPPGHAKSFAELGRNLVVPLSIGDIYKTMREQGIPAGTALAILAIFGMSLQTYDETDKAKK